MLNVRVIPTLLLKNGGLVKGEQFKNHKYVGDPLNAIKIFNEKEVDELMFLDISASDEAREPNYSLLKDLASETFMPFGYGGGITSVQQIEKIFSLGVEKVVINSAAFFEPTLIKDASGIAGSQSVVVSMDVHQNVFGKYEVYVRNGKVRTKINPVDYAKKMQDLGAGEIFLCSIDKEGRGQGFDVDLIHSVSKTIDIPVVASGGAGNLNHFRDAIKNGGASAVSAGSFFTFHGKHKAVLITYPEYSDLLKLFE